MLRSLLLLLLIFAALHCFDLVYAGVVLVLLLCLFAAVLICLLFYADFFPVLAVDVIFFFVFLHFL